MKSSAHRGNKRVSPKPVTVTNDTKYVSKVSEGIFPRNYNTSANELEQENLSDCLNLYSIICLHIFLVIAIIIGSGGIAVCVAYFNSAENTQNWKIAGIIFGAAVCIATVILMILTILKQTRNRPWRHRVKDILLHPENYFSNDIDQLSTDDDDDDDDKFQDSISDHNDQTVDTAVSAEPNTSYALLKTVHNDLIYCLGCNHLHPSTQECVNPRLVPNSLPPLKRSKSDHAQQDLNPIKKKEKNQSQTIFDRPKEYSLSNETQNYLSGNTSDNLILRRLTMPTTNVIGPQPATKIMIVRVPKVAGELVIQSKEH